MFLNINFSTNSASHETTPEKKSLVKLAKSFNIDKTDKLFLNPIVRLEDIFNKLNKPGGYATNLLPTGIVKNTKRMRFETQTISLQNDGNVQTEEENINDEVQSKREKIQQPDTILLNLNS